MANSGAALTDYEKYIRTEELLGLQKSAEALSCHDELQFQIVHQVAELWMKLCAHETGACCSAMKHDQAGAARRSLARVREILRLLLEQLSLLDNMAPVHYMTIRNHLGRGSGQESPGFRRLLQLPEELWQAFSALLERRIVTLRQLYERPDDYAELFSLAEDMVDIDQALQLWRHRHVMLVYRQIGLGTPSLKGKPSELLETGARHRFFPALWQIRDELYAEWTKTHPGGADASYHG